VKTSFVVYVIAALRPGADTPAWLSVHRTRADANERKTEYPKELQAELKVRRATLTLFDS
jgi:hypothetical protein